MLVKLVKSRARYSNIPSSRKVYVVAIQADKNYHYLGEFLEEGLVGMVIDKTTSSNIKILVNDTLYLINGQYLKRIEYDEQP
jgi:hypothetical protein